MTCQAIITIDGPAGVGKTTIARMLAQKLGIAQLPTGAMFRALALALGEDGLNLPPEELREKARKLNFSLSGNGPDSALLCNGKPLENELLDEKVSQLASQYGARAEIREILCAAQRKIGGETPLVTEGRDMGTVVFPHAACKFFLDASPKVRALRRLRQLEEMGQKPDLTSLERDISQRDAQDRERAAAPLKPAPDAVIIDSSSMTIHEVLETMLARIRRQGCFPEQN